jgi:hypothetical protein
MDVLASIRSFYLLEGLHIQETTGIDFVIYPQLPANIETTWQVSLFLPGAPQISIGQRRSRRVSGFFQLDSQRKLIYESARGRIE